MTPDPPNPRKTAQSLYGKLTSDRDPHLTRARKCAQITLPALLPPQGTTGSTQLYVPYQSVGARGTNNLANAMTMALLPPSAPFFRFLMDEQTKAELIQDETRKAEVDAALGSLERSIMVKIEQLALRSTITEMFKHLIVTGSSLLVFDAKGKPRLFRLDNFVVRRSPDGTVLDVITEEQVAFGALPPDVKEMILSLDTNSPEDYPEDKTVNLYTHIYKEGNKYRTLQECHGQIIPGTEGSYPIDAPKFLALRWVKQDGSSYGRSHCEEYIGDLNAIEGLSKDVLEGSAIAARTIFGVNPSSPAASQIKQLSQLRNGGFAVFREGDIHALRTNKAEDLSITSGSIDKLERRLSMAFLMNSAIQRDAERVTAEEIRYMAGELENAFGGIYSLMSQEFQLPLVNIVMRVMESESKLPPLPKDVITPTVVTGTEALGRGQDLTKLDHLLTRLGQLGPEALGLLNLSTLVTRIATALAIDTDGLVKTQEQLEAEQQAQQEQISNQQMADIAGKAVGPAIASAQKAQVSDV